MNIYIAKMQHVKSAHAHRAWHIEECRQKPYFMYLLNGFVTHTFWHYSSFYMLITRHAN